ncbi:MAG: class I SAM-dependent methyltransferase [bacterium]|nr:class I SAM-dependent methyltransferase [bacterium]
MIDDSNPPTPDSPKGADPPLQPHRTAARGSYFHHFDFGLGAYADQLLVRVRNTVVDTFLREFELRSEESILDVGASADDHPSSNPLEKRWPHSDCITAVGVADARELMDQFPGLRHARADGRALPFGDDSFDLVFSHAVIEHVGSTAEQVAFTAELCRVARRGVCLTTPNRWHPVEPHTGLPLLHWLPPAVHRRIYGGLGKAMYASEENLHLLSRGHMEAVLRAAGVAEGAHQLLPVRWLGIPSNWIALIRLDSGRAARASAEVG